MIDRNIYFAKILNGYHKAIVDEDGGKRKRIPENKECINTHILIKKYRIWCYKKNLQYLSNSHLNLFKLAYF